MRYLIAFDIFWLIIVYISAQDGNYGRAILLLIGIGLGYIISILTDIKDSINKIKDNNLE
jgi:xanthine/uracil permease